jgi:hypothetical protein
MSEKVATGGCHCGAIRYEVDAPPRRSSLCHCVDCRRAAGAPLVGWIAFAAGDIRVTAGTPRVYASSDHGRRSFCDVCGTGLFYTSDAFLPGIVDVQTATLDDPAAFPPTDHVQLADRIGWMETAHALPGFARYPEA